MRATVDYAIKSYNRQRAALEAVTSSPSLPMPRLRVRGDVTALYVALVVLLALSPFSPIARVVAPIAVLAIYLRVTERQRRIHDEGTE